MFHYSFVPHIATRTGFDLFILMQVFGLIRQISSFYKTQVQRSKKEMLCHPCLLSWGSIEVSLLDVKSYHRDRKQDWLTTMT